MEGTHLRDDEDQDRELTNIEFNRIFLQLKCVELFFDPLSREGLSDQISKVHIREPQYFELILTIINHEIFVYLFANHQLSDKHELDSVAMNK